MLLCICGCVEEDTHWSNQTKHQQVEAKLDYALLRPFLVHRKIRAHTGKARRVQGNTLHTGILRRGVWAGSDACVAAALHPSRTEHDHFVCRIVAGISTECCTRWMHYGSGASLRADILLTANCTNRAKSPSLSKSVSRASAVSKSKIWEIWNWHVRSVARDLCQWSQTTFRCKLVRAVRLSASWLIVQYIGSIPDPLQDLMWPKTGQETNQQVNTITGLCIHLLNKQRPKTSLL